VCGGMGTNQACEYECALFLIFSKKWWRSRHYLLQKHSECTQ